jgi:ubiquinone/menaquinone biosynthesis C-methylase UbiE
MTERTESFQLPIDIAEAYEATFVPKLFSPWAVMLVHHAGVAPGDHVLDVACGTGVVARAAADAGGTVTGVDLNEAMLAVAARIAPGITWRHGDAGQLPFPDDAFDVVLCQAALMFLPDPVGALQEMTRVVRPGGTVGVQVWDTRDHQPAYAPLIDVVARHAGDEGVNLLDAYFSLGEIERLLAMTRRAGLSDPVVRTAETTMRFPSVATFVDTEVGSTPLGERLHEDVIEAIVDDASHALEGFIGEGGAIDVTIRGHIAVARG